MNAPFHELNELTLVVHEVERRDGTLLAVRTRNEPAVRAVGVNGSWLTQVLSVPLAASKN